jgi:hypothetical protein
MPYIYPRPPAKTRGSNIYVKVFEKKYFWIFLPENTTPFLSRIQNSKKIWGIKKFRNFGSGAIIRVYFRLVHKNTPKHLSVNYK